MLREITLGQYYQTDSVIHRLDPRVKLMTTIFYIISLFIVDNIIGYVIAGLFLAMVIKLSKVPLKFMVRGMKSIIFLLLIAVVFNLFLTPGEAVLTFWKLRITKEGIRMAAFMAIRLVFLIIEGIRHKPIDRNREAMVHFVGFVLLMTLMLVITYCDIERLLS